MSTFSSREFRDTLGCFATGVTIVTTSHQDQMLGMTVNSFASVSLEPPLVLWSLSKEGASFEAYAKARFYNIHILGQSQKEVSSKFANPDPQKFNGIEWAEDERGMPLIAGCKAVLHCEHEAVYPGGDHLIVVGKVTGITKDNGENPLLFAQGCYSRLEG